MQWLKRDNLAVIHRLSDCKYFGEKLRHSFSKSLILSHPRMGLNLMSYNNSTSLGRASIPGALQVNFDIIDRHRLADSHIQTRLCCW